LIPSSPPCDLIVALLLRIKEITLTAARKHTKQRGGREHGKPVSVPLPARKEGNERKDGAGIIVSKQADAKNKQERLCLVQKVGKKKMQRGPPFDYRVEPHQASPDVLKERQWCKIRFFLESSKNTEEDFLEALKDASSCAHLDAVFLTGVIGNASSIAEARGKLLANGEKTRDPRSLCFSALLSDPCDMVRLKQAADAGYAHAQIKLAKKYRSIPTERQAALALATLSADQGDRLGCEWVAFQYRNGQMGCSKDFAKNLYYLRWACYLHESDLLRTMHMILEELDPERWFWLGQLASSDRESAAWTISDIIDEYHSQYIEQRPCDGTMMPRIRCSGVRARDKFQDKFQDTRGAVFEIGRALFIFPKLRKESRKDKEDLAIRFFRFQSDSCRAAIDQWCLIASRRNLLINRDIRKKVAFLIWASRNDSLYRFENEKAPTKKKKKIKTFSR